MTFSRVFFGINTKKTFIQDFQKTQETQNFYSAFKYVAAAHV